MSHDLILQHLKGATAQAPITLIELAQRTKLLPDRINELLDEMHQCIPAMINKVKITRAGQSTIVAWPTGVIQPFSYHAKQYATPARPPRNPEPAKETTVQTENVANVEVPRTLQILRFIENHPGCSVHQITDGTKITSPIAYVKGYADKGLVFIEGERGQKSLSLKPDTRAEDIFNSRRHAAANKPAAEDKPTAQQLAYMQPSAQLQAQAELNAANAATAEQPVIDENWDGESGPGAEDGHDWEGFIGGCERFNCGAGCSKELPGGRKEEVIIPTFLKPHETKLESDPDVLAMSITEIMEILPVGSSISLKRDNSGTSVELLLPSYPSRFYLGNNVQAIPRLVEATQFIESFRSA